MFLTKVGNKKGMFASKKCYEGVAREIEQPVSRGGIIWFPSETLMQ
jgi:hypothetical protein